MFNFMLKDIKDIAPFGNSETERHVHWYALTDSYYWINVGKEELLRYAEPSVHNLGLNVSYPYVDYYLTRFIEDFTKILPYVLTPIPDDVFEHVASVQKTKITVSLMQHWIEEVWDETDQQYDEVYPPLINLFSRKLDLGYLRNAPDIWFFRYNDDIIVQWNCVGSESPSECMWTATMGEHKLDISTFVKYIVDFLNLFIDQMDEQVVKAESHTLPEAIILDTSQLQKSHVERRGVLLDQIAKLQTDKMITHTDWEQVRKSLDLIKNGY